MKLKEVMDRRFISEIWFNKEGEKHRLDGPAAIHHGNNTSAYYIDGGLIAYDMIPSRDLGAVMFSFTAALYRYHKKKWGQITDYKKHVRDPQRVEVMDDAIDALDKNGYMTPRIIKYLKNHFREVIKADKQRLHDLLDKLEADGMG